MLFLSLMNCNYSPVWSIQVIPQFYSSSLTFVKKQVNASSHAFHGGGQSHMWMTRWSKAECQNSNGPWRLHQSKSFELLSLEQCFVSQAQSLSLAHCVSDSCLFPVFIVHCLPDVHLYVKDGWYIIVNIPFLTVILIAKQLILELDINNVRLIYYNKLLQNWHLSSEYSAEVASQFKAEGTSLLRMRLISVNAFSRISNVFKFRLLIQYKFLFPMSIIFLESDASIWNSAFGLSPDVSHCMEIWAFSVL